MNLKRGTRLATTSIAPASDTSDEFFRSIAAHQFMFRIIVKRANLEAT